jgi:hypothetical protein
MIQPFLGPLAVKMVFSAADAVSQLMRAQFEHTLPAGKDFFAGGEYLGPSFALLATNHTFHEALIYPNPVCMSNAVSINWPQIKMSKL